MLSIRVSLDTSYPNPQTVHRDNCCNMVGTSSYPCFYPFAPAPRRAARRCLYPSRRLPRVEPPHPTGALLTRASSYLSLLLPLNPSGLRLW